MRSAICGVQRIMKNRLNRLLAVKGITIMDDKGITVRYSLANLAALYGSFIIFHYFTQSLLPAKIFLLGECSFVLGNFMCQEK